MIILIRLRFARMYRLDRMVSEIIEQKRKNERVNVLEDRSFTPEAAAELALLSSERMQYPLY